jgi:hypothetical protein
MVGSGWSVRAFGALTLAVALVTAGCGSEVDVTADELAAVVARDAVAFESSSLPGEVLELLAGQQVVLLGETHHLREHWAFVAALMGDLRNSGFRQLLVERPQMNDWLVDDYVMGGELAPDWVPSPYFDRRFTAIRELNATLPEAERIHVRSIDANEDDSGGAADFQLLFEMLVGALPSTGAVQIGLPVDYPTASPDTQLESIEMLGLVLEANRTSLVDEWGSFRFGQVAEMIEVEERSIEIRELRKEDDDAAARSREDLIKQLAERRIAEDSGGTVINIGAHHAQLSHLMGTEQEWLGDFLAHRSTVVDGAVLAVGFTSARTELEQGAGGTPFDVRASSPEHEILRVMAEKWPGQTVFLPLDAPLFVERKVSYNSEDVIYAASLGTHFDALVQYGLAHRMPID